MLLTKPSLHFFTMMKHWSFMSIKLHLCMRSLCLVKYSQSDLCETGFVVYEFDLWLQTMWLAWELRWACLPVDHNVVLRRKNWQSSYALLNPTFSIFTWLCPGGHNIKFCSFNNLPFQKIFTFMQVGILW